MDSLRARRSNLDRLTTLGSGLLRHLTPRNDVIPVLIAIGAVAALTTGFVTVAPNRLLSGRPIGLFALPNLGLGRAIGLGAAVLLATAFLQPTRALHRAVAVLAGILLLLVLAAASSAAALLGAGLPALARVSLGAGFWVLLGISALVLLDALQRAKSGIAERFLFIGLLAGATAAMAGLGQFHSLSIAREYEARHDLFTAQLVRHIVLVLAAVGPAVLIGLPLGIAALRRQRSQASVFAVLNLLQTIPSIALFGLMIVPLSALAAAAPALAVFGVSGIGPAPAIIALILYALLPIVRNTVAGIGGVDPGVVDAARGMGMTRRQMLWRVELPLALPLLLAGLRIVTVQAVGLAVVAALIGAGGLGSFVFEGLGQYAADLVLLGALPAIGLALAADFILQMLTTLATRL